MRLLPVTDPRLWGLEVRTQAGLVRFTPAADDGQTGAREPRRPKPPAPSVLAASLP